MYVIRFVHIWWDDPESYAKAVYRRKAKPCLIAFALMVFSLFCAPIESLASSLIGSAKRVLVLNSYHPEYVWGDSVIKGIRSVLDATDENIYVRYEYMDTKHNRPELLFDILKEIYYRKYHGFHFDVIIASDNNALNFLREYRNELFGLTPVVFCGVNGFKPIMIEGLGGFTGVAENYDLKGTLELALKIHPNTEHIAVISGTSTSSLINQTRLYEEMPIFKEKVDFIDLSRLNPPHLKARLEELPPNTIIIYLSYYKMPNGAFLTVAESTSFVFQHAGVPMYSPWEYTMGHGIVGGMMLSGEKQGQKAAQYAVAILKGAPADQLPVIQNSDIAPVFDYNMLEHFDIPYSSLPVDAVMKNEPQTLYYRYKYLFWAVIVFIIYQSVTIFLLARNLSRRKRAERLQKQLEAQLLHAQKMEAIGTFAGGIAHDLNNIIGAITTCGEMALEDTPKESSVSEDLRHLLLAANRGKTLIQQVLAFSRKRDRQRRPLQVKSILYECLDLLKIVIPPSVDIRLQFADQVNLISANPAKIHQIIMNLCVNADQAMRGGNGVLTLSLDQVDLSSDSDIPSPANLKPGEYVRLSVADTGNGMEPEVLARIFEPFYTTRGKRGGTGLGLAVIHGIIKSYDGAITVESTLGEGTVFCVYLPTVTMVTHLPVCQSVEGPEIGNERILLVDDDRDMLYAEHKLLERLGYSVVHCSEGSVALTTFQADPEGFDLVITDQIMPQMTGVELSQELIKLRPDLPIILCSGYTDRYSEVTPDVLREAGICDYIRKPFSSVEISQVIRNTLERPEEPSRV